MRDKLEEQRHQQYAHELRKSGWVVLHESDFTIENFHTDPYFRAVVERIVGWYQNPIQPNPEEVRRVVRLLESPLLGDTRKLGEDARRMKP